MEPITFESIVELCLQRDERAKWALFQELPHLLGVSSLADLTEEEILWLRVQLLIDQGLGRCASCTKVGPGPYCSACGKPHHEPDGEDIPECIECRHNGRLVPVKDKFCHLCGTPTEDTVFVKELKEGKVDYPSLNEMYRPKVTDEERIAIENAFGGAFWDKAGNPLTPKT